MKSICLSFISLFLLSLSSYGQNGKTIDLKDVSIHAGDSVTVKAKVINVVDGPLHNTYLLAIGNDFPKPAIKVWIVEIYDFPYYPTVLVNKGEISFTGKLENIKGQMWMMIYHSNQIKLTSKQRSAIISPPKKQSRAERKEIIASLDTLTQLANQIKDLKELELYNSIAHMDSVCFDAFNRKDIDALKLVFDENLEFYTGGGTVLNYDQNIKNLQEEFANKNTSYLKRELVKDSLKVFPLENYGAMEVATHRFVYNENGKQVINTLKFVCIWQQKNNVWKITRAISYMP